MAICRECMKHGVITNVKENEECAECYYRGLPTQYEQMMEEVDRMETER